MRVTKQSDIRDDGDGHIHVWDATETLAFPATCTWISIHGAYDYPLHLPDDFECLIYNLNYKRPKQTKLPPNAWTPQNIMFIEDFAKSTEEIIIIDKRIFYKHNADDMGAQFYSNWNVFGHKLLGSVFYAARTLEKICKMRGFGKDIGRLLYYAVRNNIIAWYDIVLSGKEFNRPTFLDPYKHLKTKNAI